MDGHYGQGKLSLRIGAGSGPVLNTDQILNAFNALPETEARMPDVKKSQVKPLKNQIRK